MKSIAMLGTLPTKGKVYKIRELDNVSNLRIVTIYPGNREVAGRFEIRKTFKFEESLHNIQIPGMALTSNAGLPILFGGLQ